MNETLVGSRLGKYAVEAEIGRGGMGVVYRGRDAALDRAVALKVLSPSLTTDAALVRRFRREAVTAARLNHPHLAKIYEVGEQDGVFFIAMEYVAGQVLSDLLEAEGKLSVTFAVHIVIQLSEALDYAHHTVGLVHGDIKPSNIIIRPNGSAVLTDFGLAQALSSAGEATEDVGEQDDPHAGTPLYMSPEHVKGQSVDARSDIYSLGVLLYQMTTGRPPFNQRVPEALFYAHVHQIPESPRRFEPDLPVGLERIILRMLHKDPERRYTSTADLAAALRRLDGEASGVGLPRTAAIVVAAGIVALLAGWLVVRGLATSPAPATSTAPVVLALAPPIQPDASRAATTSTRAWVTRMPSPVLTGAAMGGDSAQVTRTAAPATRTSAVSLEGALTSPPAIKTGTPTDAPTPTDTPSPTATSTGTATSTPLPSPTNRATRTPSPTATNSATSTSSPSPTNTATWTPSPTATGTATPSPTSTNTATWTPMATESPTPTPLVIVIVVTSTPTPALATPTPWIIVVTATPSDTPPPTSTGTATPTATPTATRTPAPPTATKAFTPVPLVKPTVALTVTPTAAREAAATVPTRAVESATPAADALTQAMLERWTQAKAAPNPEALEAILAEDPQLDQLVAAGVPANEFWSALTAQYIAGGNRLRGSGQPADAAAMYRKAVSKDTSGMAQLMLDGMQPYLADPSLLLLDNFDDNRNKWRDEGDMSDERLRASIGDGRFWLSSTSKCCFWYYTLCDLGADVSNAVAQVEAQMVQGDPTGQFGIVIDDGRGNKWCMRVTADGNYWLRQTIGGQESGLPIGNTGASNANSNQVYTLGLSAVDRTLTGIVNGRQVAKLDSPLPISGKVGLIVGPGKEPIVVGFDNLRIWRAR